MYEPKVISQSLLQMVGVGQRDKKTVRFHSTEISLANKLSTEIQKGETSTQKHETSSILVELVSL